VRPAITERELCIVRSILTRIIPDAEYLVFGSRLHTRHHRYSDLDIAIKAAGKVSLPRLSALEEAFAESDLPFRVDIVDLQRASAEFRRLVELNHVSI
jgi:type I restriction enzyme S subunit